MAVAFSAVKYQDVLFQLRVHGGTTDERQSN